MKYYLDTNIIVYFMKGAYPKIKEHFEQIRREDIGIPSIVIAEIEFGARNSINYDKTMRIYKPFIDTFDCVGFYQKEAGVYGEIRAKLKKLGTIIGPNDLIVAATAKANDAVIVTHNTKEFSRVDGLKVEDWTL